MARPHPDSMQQIAILIITFLVYVHSITIPNTNTNSNTNSNTNTNTNESFYSTKNVNIYNGFDNKGVGSSANGAGAQDETGAGAGAAAGVGVRAGDYGANEKSFKNFPKRMSFNPSEPYDEAEGKLNKGRQSDSFQPVHIIGFTPDDAVMPKQYPPSYENPAYSSPAKLMEYAMKRYSSADSPFKFPNPINNNNQYAGGRPPFNLNNYNTPTEVPNFVQSTPIVSYLDPYTNQNYQYTSPPNLPASYNQPPASQKPQEFTVQSSMLVEHQKRPGGSSPSNSFKRPGLVFDEKIDGNYQTSPKYRPAPQQSLGNQREKPSDSGTKISYDSHDYPPPSYADYQTSNFKRPPVTTKPTPPTKPPPQPTRPAFLPTIPPPVPQSQFNYDIQRPNYINNVDNYLQTSRPPLDYYPLPPQPQPQPQPQQQRPPPGFDNEFQYKPLNGGRPIFGQPAYNDYYQYQLGEVPPPPPPPQPQPQPLPPQLQNQLYRPYPPPQGGPVIPPPPQYPSGLASLAALFAPNQQQQPQLQQQQQQQQHHQPQPQQQQYAPQFSNNPFGSLLGALTSSPPAKPPPSYGGYGNNGPSFRPLNTQLLKALENIARNDDLQCVPKVLCQMIAGQTQRGQLPSFITSPAITNFLASFPASSPALIYGRAALLGISGGESSCTQTYVQCPKNEYEILYYLNNHRGGFFKFFSEPDESQDYHQQPSTSNGGNSFLSILAALTGNSFAPPSTTTARPTRPPRPPAAFGGTPSDITSGIGNFFTKLLSEYVSGPTVEYERRKKRRTKRSASHFFDDSDYHRIENFEQDLYGEEFEDILESEDFHDEEDNEDTQQGHDYTGLDYRPRKGFRFEDEPQNPVKFENEVPPSSFNQVRFMESESRGRQPKMLPHKNQSKNLPQPQKPRPSETSESITHEPKMVKFPTPTNERLYINTPVNEEKWTRYGRSIKLGDEISSNEKKDQQNITSISPDSKHQITFNDSYEHRLRQARIVNKPHFEFLPDPPSPYEKGGNEILLYNHDEKPIEEFESEPPYEKEIFNRFGPPSEKLPYPNLVIHPNLLSSFSDRFNSNGFNDNKFASSSHPYSISHSNSIPARPYEPAKPYFATSTHSSLNSQLHHQHTHREESYPKYEIPDFQKYASNPSSSQNTYIKQNSINNNNYIHQNNIQNNYHQQNSVNHNYQTSNSNANYQYPANRQTSTRRPYRNVQDDKNIYVTNGYGVTEYYITPDGRKVYLK